MGRRKRNLSTEPLAPEPSCSRSRGDPGRGAPGRGARHLVTGPRCRTRSYRDISFWFHVSAAAGSGEADLRQLLLTTMSGLVLPTIWNSSSCSAAGTLNLSSDFLNSAAMTSHSFSEMFRCACADFMSLPVYLHGPPVASHISCDTWTFRYGGGDALRPALIAGFLFSVLLATSRSMKSSTTRLMPLSPPRRS